MILHHYLWINISKYFPEIEIYQVLCFWLFMSFCLHRHKLWQNFNGTMHIFVPLSILNFQTFTT